MSFETAEKRADAIADELAAAGSGTGELRAIRRRHSQQLRTWSADDVIEVALLLVGRHRWVAYELVYDHPTAPGTLTATTVERLAETFDGWGSVDAFGRYIAGPAWRLGAVGDDLIRSWADRQDRWWRRAALVSTVPLNLRAAGGSGDTARTLDICRRLVDDRDDMVVKALSWALRELVHWDPDAVRRFLTDHEPALAARVRREVTSKLDTGLKSPTSRR